MNVAILIKSLLQIVERRVWEITSGVFVCDSSHHLRYLDVIREGN